MALNSRSINRRLLLNTTKVAATSIKTKSFWPPVFCCDQLNKIDMSEEGKVHLNEVIFTKILRHHKNVWNMVFWCAKQNIWHRNHKSKANVWYLLRWRLLSSKSGRWIEGRGPSGLGHMWIMLWPTASSHSLQVYNLHNSALHREVYGWDFPCKATRSIPSKGDSSCATFHKSRVGSSRLQRVRYSM